MTHLLAYSPMVGLFVLLWILAIVYGAGAVVASLIWVGHQLTVRMRSRREPPG